MTPTDRTRAWRDRNADRMVMKSLYLDTATVQTFKDHADRLGVSFAELVREAMTAHLPALTADDGFLRPGKEDR